MSRFRKIYIDSHHRTQNSNSSSDSEIYLLCPKVKNAGTTPNYTSTKSPYLIPCIQFKRG